MEQIATQNMLLLSHLKKGNSITSLQAIRQFGITRLASRICDLRQSGINVQDEWLVEYNRYGQKTRFKKYFLAKGDKNEVI